MKKQLDNFILFLPLALLFFFFAFYQSLPNDTVQYSALGYNLFHHGVFSDAYGVLPGWMQSPGWPFVCGVFSLVLPPQKAAPLAAVLISMLLLYVLFLFSEKNFNRRVAWLAVILFALNPQFIISARSGLSEPLYVLFHLLLFIRLYGLLIEGRRLTISGVFLLSLLSAALLLTRAEGVLYIFFIAALLFYFYQWQGEAEKRELPQKQPLVTRISGSLKRLYKPALFLIFTFVLLLPYGLWIKNKSGHFNLTPKVTFNKRIGKVAAVLKQNKDLYLRDEEVFQEMVWFGLDTNSYTLYAENILNDDYYEKLVRQLPAQESSLTFLPKLLQKNLLESFRVFIFSDPFPVVFLLFILAGLFYSFKQQKKLLWLIVFWLAPAFYFLISHVEERFFYVMLPYLSLIAAFAIEEFSKARNKGPLIRNTALLLLLFNASFYYKDYAHKLNENQAYYQAALVLEKTIPHGGRVCAKNFSVTFYSGRPFVKMPYCSAEDLKKYLIKHKTVYLLLGREVEKLRPAFKPVFRHPAANGFLLVKEIKTPTQLFRLLKWTP